MLIWILTGRRIPKGTFFNVCGLFIFNNRLDLHKDLGRKAILENTHAAKLAIIPYLTFSHLSKSFGGWYFEIFVIFFPENRIWHFMQIVSTGDNLHEMSDPVFWKKKIKESISLAYAELAKIVVRLNNAGLCKSTFICQLRWYCSIHHNIIGKVHMAER